MAIETRILQERSDVNGRLAEIGLTLDGLLRVVDIARSAGANATRFHCRNAWGTLSYQWGTWALRNEFVGAIWVLDRPEGVEAICNPVANVRVAFSNVDLTCDNLRQPKPRSDKGAGAERVCEGNLLFDDLPHFAPEPTCGTATFYLMADEVGGAELSRPVIGNKTFAGYIERIYLRAGGDDEIVPPLSLDDDDALTDFDPKVARK